uniref:FBA_2 domain-containing protein n=1 Tax=Steinernema glaseri TaxID=37863 RepID=A0A1I7YIG0_9BILA
MIRDVLKEMTLVEKSTSESDSEASIGAAGQENSKEQEGADLLTMPRKDTSTPQSGMASVPYAFRERVCVTLREGSLRTVRFLLDTPSWSSVAEKVYAQSKDFELNGPVDGYFDSHINLWHLQNVEIHRCTLNSAVPLCTWLKKVLRKKYLHRIVITENSFEKPKGRQVDFKEKLYNALRNDVLMTVAINNNRFFTNMKISFAKRVLDYWIASEEGFQERFVTLDAHAMRRQWKKEPVIKDLYEFGERDELLHASQRQKDPLTMPRQNTSTPQSSMASVPFAFRESVCATLGEGSLRTVRFLFDAPSWSSVARKVEAESRDFELRMKLEGAKVSYNSSISLEEAIKAKYLRCSWLTVSSGNPDENTDWNVTPQTLYSVVKIEWFYLRRINLRSVVDYFSHINPWYLKSVRISFCKFTSALPLCTWLKKVLTNKCFSYLHINYISFAKSIKPKLDLSEEVYDALVHHKRLKEIDIHDNDSIKDLDIPFFRRVLDFWVASENGFQRKLTLRGPTKRKLLKKKEKTQYNFSGDLLCHASDSILM